MNMSRFYTVRGVDPLLWRDLRKLLHSNSNFRKTRK